MRSAVLLLPGVLLAGCVSSSDLDRLHREVNDLHADVLKVREESATRADVQKAGQGLEKETQRIVRANADLALKVNEFSTEIEALQEQLRDTNARLTQLSQQLVQNQRSLEQLRGQMAAAAPPPPPPSPARRPPLMRPPPRSTCMPRPTATSSRPATRSPSRGSRSSSGSSGRPGRPRTPSSTWASRNST
jgi:outer membrane murein-binding lipoprotein Lpp